MSKRFTLTITSAAAAELTRQAAFAGKPGLMYLDFLQDTSGEGWFFLRLQPGRKDGVPVARIDGVTLYAHSEQLEMLSGLTLNYYGDLSGGGFVITPPEQAESSSCGSGFRYLKKSKPDKNSQ